MERATLIDELEDALARGPSDERAVALHRITDLFVSGAAQYSDEQIALFDDVIGRFAAEIEVSARAALSERLAPIPQTPPGLVRAFAFDSEGCVAGPVLTHSPRLDDATLIAVSSRMPNAHLLAISRRKTLSPAVADLLIEKGDLDVVRSTVSNTGARFSDPGFSLLLCRSEGDEELAASVGLRPDLPRHLFLRLLARASETVRQKLTEHNSRRAREVQNAVAAAARRIDARIASASRDYRQADQHIALLRAAGRLDESALARFAAAGRFEETAMTLAELSCVAVDIVERALLQERPETLLILGKAAGLGWDTMKVLLQHGRSHGMSVHDFDQCVASYARLKPGTATMIVRLPRFAKSARGLAQTA